MRATLYDEWLIGNAVAVGRTLMDRLKPAQQLLRCVAVLELCASRCERIAQVEETIAVGRDVSRWHEGHDVFDHIRRLTLVEENRRTPSRSSRPCACVQVARSHRAAAILLETVGSGLAAEPPLRRAETEP
jgi:hypothetical protein